MNSKDLDKASVDCPQCGGIHFGDAADVCPLSPDYVPSKPWPKPMPRPAPTIRDAISLIEKMEKCEGMPAKLILLRNFILKIAGRAPEENAVSVEYNQASELDADEFDAEFGRKEKS